MVTLALGDTMKLQIYRDKKREWRWRLRHRNGNIMAESGEGYKRSSSCLRAFDSVHNVLRANTGKMVYEGVT